MSTPPYAIAYAATYDSTTDLYVFTFVSGYTPQHIPRIGFNYVLNTGISNGMTFFSEFSPGIPVNNGLTVNWTLATAPTGAVSALDLFNKIVALGTGGGGGTVTSVAGGNNIQMTGTATDPIVNVKLTDGRFPYGSSGTAPGVQPVLPLQIGVWKNAGNDIAGVGLNPGEFSFSSDGSYGAGVPTSMNIHKLDVGGLTPYYILGAVFQPNLQVLFAYRSNSGGAGGLTSTKNVVTFPDPYFTVPFDASANSMPADTGALYTFMAQMFPQVVTSVTAGTNVTLGGTATDPVINASGGGSGTVTSVTAGTAITVTGTATDPIINNAGVNSVTAGTNVTITGTATNPIISASGGGGGGTVTSVTAGSGIVITGTATDPIVSSVAGNGANLVGYAIIRGSQGATLATSDALKFDGTIDIDTTPGAWFSNFPDLYSIQYTGPTNYSVLMQYSVNATGVIQAAADNHITFQPRIDTTIVGSPTEFQVLRDVTNAGKTAYGCVSDAVWGTITTNGTITMPVAATTSNIFGTKNWSMTLYLYK